ncbi:MULTISPECIES: serine hydrolase domain-containing protein [Streptomyces]|uniref:Esterase n=1 Tax=Streptomyces tsukubensis (strain DSM 42081 / NBRC 108919 / NRRL 18488 / 9993) TaxID=1114943 RepID=A0A7G3UFT4_STRT9|nr:MULTISPECIES: serine hydrolase domain-containing protein [Streptomyces]AZK95540.1 esterase [Streptomyces tsukubensis]MYS66671.1 serine hydrolase [Streptomyces sp. SID5473]QKM68421.1 esterase [Streptomyces tsukubensis NRRL18488]TAI43238.1 class A beta-lactamase-related serine hydrolase [Streptomyces tsukubensis]
MTVINGEVAAGFEPVLEAFAANFARREEIGAAVCVYQDGRPVVDLWAGVADPDTGRPWERDTLQLVYSATKGATATAAHLLAQRGELDLDAPVAEYWPEFAANGKAEIPVRWLLSHQAGLVALDEPVPLDEALAWHPMTAALAAQRPQWTPGTAHGYHGRTWGWLVGEVIRRVSGRTPGRFFTEEIARPLGLDFFIGLPPGERDRVSRMVYRKPDVDLTTVPEESVPEDLRDLVAAWRDPNSLSNRAFAVTDPANIDFDSPEVQAAELPSSNGIGTAHALARMYAALIGEVDGVRLLTPETLALATEEQAHGRDQVMVVPSRFTSGFMLPTAAIPMTGSAAFGHTGRGGSLGFADPEHVIAFGYVMNHIISGSDDMRATALTNAVHKSLGMQ